ncbi:YhcG family protein [Cellulomonas sp. 179-A 4D5 NHS]|uniref:PDDEXK nuclease domain-containing protein n=1 Tax=Cellulomonas sp. 179-A 4D5 NHS TaxID=3142378 RepID=UPI0039A3952B
MSTELTLPSDYTAVLADLKTAVRTTRHRAHRLVNTELLALYWRIGETIRARQDAGEWGAKVIDRLASDLRAEFPDMTGLRRSSMYYMRAFAAAWPGEAIVQQPVGRLPWGHIAVLLDKLDDAATRDWYAAAADTHGWSRNVLLNQIMSRAHERLGAAPSNFPAHLDAPDSELAQQLAKDPYIFDFLGLSHGVAERDFEQALMDRLMETLRELGAGFAFVGRQVHVDVDGDDFYVDLLFFHVAQLRYVVVELKMGKFKPDYAGQLGFYVSLVDDRLRLPVHQPTVGLLLCADKNESTVRYALSSTAAPVAVATYTYDSLPPAEREALPSERQMMSALTASLQVDGRSIDVTEYLTGPPAPSAPR